MARSIPERDISPVLHAADHWIDSCLIESGAILKGQPLWTPDIIDEVSWAFVDHPDDGKADFMTKLDGQMKRASPSAQQLMADMIWALLLFPSNMKASTKRNQIVQVYSLSGIGPDASNPMLSDDVLAGIGSGGMGFHNYRPDELRLLIAIARDLKNRSVEERRSILRDYDHFVAWIEGVPRQGARQFRHMLRYFAFPDRVERMSSNGDRRKILEGFKVAPHRETRKWSDQQLDAALFDLRSSLTPDYHGVLDFYSDDLKAKWAPKQKVRTPEGEVDVVVPLDDEDEEDNEAAPEKTPDARQSLRVQAALTEIGRLMGFKVWIPRSDRARVLELVSPDDRPALVDDLPLNYDNATLSTIEQIDVLWMKGRSIVRAFEVEHTTAVYSGLLRMADLLALQPNMAIRLHIVAPEERREKVMREMMRPVFSLLDRGPLADTCTFISYDSVAAIRKLEHLAYTTDSVLSAYEERAEAQ